MSSGVTRKEMQELDRRAIDEFLIPGLILMENAGRSVADIMCRHFSAGNILVFCGKGNNGGDGLVVARHLMNRGHDVRILFFSDPNQMMADPLLNFRIVERMKIPWEIIPHENTSRAVSDRIQRADVLVDAIFGVGLNAPVGGIHQKVISQINVSGKKVVAVDIPSGICADTGQVLGEAVRADMTVTFGCAKKGLYLGEGPHYSGKIWIADISIPRKIL